MYELNHDTKKITMTKEFYNDYKEDIKSTRTHAVGSSDAKMLKQIAELGMIPQSAYRRMAVCKGLIEQEEIPYTDAVRFGDEIEQKIFEHLQQKNSDYISNPRWVSKIFSRKNCDCITHPDIVRIDESKRIIFVYEVKASKHSTIQVQKEYEAQLYHHYILANEKAKSMGNRWGARICLVHYNTQNLDLSQPQEFDLNRITIRQIRFNKARTFDLAKAMDIVDAFLEDFTEYYPEDEVDYNHLPAKVQSQFDNITTLLKEIKERESKVNEFKERLFSFLTEKNIKSIKNDSWSITRVDATKSKSFDYKKFLSDYAEIHPRLYVTLLKKYEKETARKGSILIKIKDKNTNQ